MSNSRFLRLAASVVFLGLYPACEALKPGAEDTDAGESVVVSRPEDRPDASNDDVADDGNDDDDDSESAPSQGGVVVIVDDCEGEPGEQIDPAGNVIVVVCLDDDGADDTDVGPVGGSTDDDSSEDDDSAEDDDSSDDDVTERPDDDVSVGGPNGDDDEHDDSPPEDDDVPPEDDDVPPEDDDAPPEDDDAPPDEDNDVPPENDDVPPEDDDTPEPPDSPLYDGLCRPAVGESFPARSVVMSNSVTAPSQAPVFVKDVFDRFRSVCGGCHVEQSLGEFQVTEATFTDKVTRQVIGVITQDGPNVMPPGTAFSSRPQQDPVRELVGLLTQWRDAVEPVLATGALPPQVFFPPAPPPSAEASPYLLSPELGDALTNLGSCIPAPELVNTEGPRSGELDAMFEAMVDFSDLPKTLSETDLSTLDSAELAKRGVISYAPTYTLFSDDAGKMRYVRVPRGQTITFDPSTQEFDIPPNTRFYKTFLKQVKDKTGRVSWRKIETRIIVSRPDVRNPDGSYTHKAIFGTYQWDPTNEDRAILVEDPLRDGQPFRDRLFVYQRDEVAAEALIASAPPDLERQLAEKELARHYGIPGSQRCIECHRGSPQHSFILGFGPLQVNRQPTGQEGTFETASVDELSQLQRLLDYGVITGISDPTDPDEVFPLSKTQALGPRNQHELRAQGYMVGNCGFCHNPTGVASVENPVLTTQLNMWPSNGGGVFYFPLEVYSPRIFRGPNATTRIPYVTPPLDETDSRISGLATNRNLKKYFAAANSPESVFFAPWRSLIYRNTETPFTYADDNALFPKMPRNVPGHDLRASRIMGEWMSSIPAVLLPPLPGGDFPEQPYREVLPGEPDYGAAVAEAEARLQKFRTGGRFDCVPVGSPGCNLNDFCNRCPDTRDIVAHEVLESISKGVAPLQLTPVDEVPIDYVPDRAHWVNTDLSEPPLDYWAPRRSDWERVFGYTTDPPVFANETEEQTVEMLKDVVITEEFRAFALGERPMTFWDPNPECDFTQAQTGLTYSGPGPTGWMDLVDPNLLNQPVYLQSPGEAVFTNICSNCHGPQADSQGRQALSVALMSGGETRVANLRDGLLGEGNIAEEFGPRATAQVSPLDLAGRYVSWMALGGTQRQVPSAIMDLIATTRVFGYSRRNNRGAVGQSANMLEVAVSLCAQVIGDKGTTGANVLFDLDRGNLDHYTDDHVTSLIGLTGDAEMWFDLCTYDNPPPIMVVGTNRALAGIFSRTTSEGRELVPADAPMGNHWGESELGLQPGNRFPWCILPDEQGNPPGYAQTWKTKHTGPIPMCPSSLVATWQNQSPTQPDQKFVNALGDEEIKLWARRGAINAGLAVLVYLLEVQGGLAPHPPYNQCELRPQ